MGKARAGSARPRRGGRACSHSATVAAGSTEHGPTHAWVWCGGLGTGGKLA